MKARGQAANQLQALVVTAPETLRDRLGRLSHLWVDAGYRGRSKRWVEEVMGLRIRLPRESTHSFLGRS